MSKEAALRAMREARYNERNAGSATASRAAKPAVRAAKPAVAKPSSPVAEAPVTNELCGHRSMNGRTCTREHGHAAKSHRYS
jgi:hypothetical protein